MGYWRLRDLMSNAATYPLLKMNHRHTAIMEWLVANPHRNKKQCAIDLGYTPMMIYNIVNSDLFQARYKERCAELHVIAAHLFENRIAGVAELALERTEERLQETVVNGAGELVHTVSDRFLGDTVKNTLAALGYLNGNRETAPTIVNQIIISQESLDEARAKKASITIESTPDA